MYNKVILIGNLTKDPDVRFTPSGVPVTTARLAVTTKYKQGDETREDTLFIDVVIFGKQAEISGQYLSKGNPVLVEGRLKERRWEADGTQKSKVEVIANTIRFLPRRETRPQTSSDDFKYASGPPEEITDVEPF